MSNYFSIENPLEVYNVTDNYGFIGFENNGINPVKIDDGLMESGDALNKMGASIPTPYARLFLFSSAFKQVNNEEGKPGFAGDGHKGVIDVATGNRVPSAYHYLTSECLDMLEYIFKYGDDPKFSVIEWNIDSECNKLLIDPNPRHTELGKALKAAHKGPTLRIIDQIFLFLWDGKVIGGTSPITLVYTSPNLRDVLAGVNFVGGQGNRLFDNTKSVPLYKRSEDFRRFLYTYLLTDLAPIETCRDLKKYIENSRDNYDKVLNDKMIAEGLLRYPELSKVKALETKEGVITSAGAQLYCSNNDPDLTTSDYRINATVNIYQHEHLGGDLVDVDVPLVLTPSGIHTATYIVDRKWSKVTDIIPPVLDETLSTRKLPGTQYTYPFVTVDDFLEDKIIEVSYIVRNTAFLTGSKKNTRHILPLKKGFFKFFEVSDLIDHNGNPTDMICVSVDEKEIITVELYIPIRCGTITFRKVYDKTKKVDCYQAASTFGFAFFPFYRLAIKADGQDNNVYNIMLGATKEGVSTKFYKIVDLCKSTDKQFIENVTVQDRTVGEIKTTHINVPSSFDMMEVCVEGTKGLIVPLFKEINSASATNRFYFCIDFGTTNTHVAYAKADIGHVGHIIKDKVKDLDITDSDSQVVTLHNDAGVAEFVKLTTFMQREFVPARIGENQRLQFPMRTTTCQIDTNVDNLKMFDNTNVGFNYNEELSAKDLLSCKYYTNIKWERKDVFADQRLKEYFKEMLWIMKNKAVMNAGTENFKVIVTYPQSMRESEADAFIDSWNRAKDEVKSAVCIDFQYESVTPYYSFLSELEYGEPYVNFDIGGGTTDILYVNPDTREAISLSALFAANDLWGDGADPMVDPNQNGFVKFYLHSDEYNSMTALNQSTIQSVVRNSNSSADIMSYLFAHDDVSNVSHAIGASPEMMQLLIAHFSSLIFYMAYVIDLGELEVPSKITFTGMGSKYIKLISRNTGSIANMIRKIFAYYGRISQNLKLKDANIDVKFSDNPKVVTAQGGLILNGHPHPIVPDNTLYFGYEGEEFGHSLRYRDLADSRSGVIELFRHFAKLFNDEEFNDVMDDLNHSIEEDFSDHLQRFAKNSFALIAATGAEAGLQARRLKEPLFFWPLKNSLYIIGKQFSDNL